MFSKGDWRARLEFITTVFSKNGSQAETAPFIVFLVVVGAIVLIEWNLTVTRSSEDCIC